MAEIVLALALQNALMLGFEVGKCMGDPSPGWEEGSECQRKVEAFDKLWDKIQDNLVREDR